METIKRIGRYTVPFEVFTDVVAELKLAVAPEGQELPPAAELAALEAQEQAEAEAAAPAPEPEPEYLSDEPEPAAAEEPAADADAAPSETE
jgi:hypothetical protein